MPSQIVVDAVVAVVVVFVVVDADRTGTDQNGTKKIIRYFFLSLQLYDNQKLWSCFTWYVKYICFKSQFLSFRTFLSKSGT